MNEENKIILSGVQPSGKLHLGNYFGAIKQWLEMQEKHKSYFMIADYHALNSVQDASKMREYIDGVILDYLALGLDPEKSVLFKQSDVPEHTELTWIFDTITTVPYLKRAHAYKDTVEKKGEDAVSVGTFNYPMLMAADILLYSPDLVPVGQDQKQHIEFARDTAEKFNRIYGETFKLPEPHILENVQTVPGIDGRKMSKSYGNYIPLFAEDNEIEELVMSIVTDSNAEYPENVFKIHQLFRKSDELDKIYTENKGQYKKLKEMLALDIKNFIGPLREARNKIDKSTVEKVLKEGAEKAREVASAKIEEVKKAIGVK